MLAKVSIVFIMINKGNTNQALIKIKRFKKVQHIDSVQRSQTDGPSYGRTGRYTLVDHGALHHFVFLGASRNQ